MAHQLLGAGLLALYGHDGATASPRLIHGQLLGQCQLGQSRLHSLLLEGLLQGWTQHSNAITCEVLLH